MARATRSRARHEAVQAPQEAPASPSMMQSAMAMLGLGGASPPTPAPAPQTSPSIVESVRRRSLANARRQKLAKAAAAEQEQAKEAAKAVPTEGSVPGGVADAPAPAPSPNAAAAAPEEAAVERESGACMPDVRIEAVGRRRLDEV